VGHEPKKIAQLGNVQLTILIAVCHLEFRFEESQQLRLGYRAFILTSGDCFRVVDHDENLHRERIT